MDHLTHEVDIWCTISWSFIEVLFSFVLAPSDIARAMPPFQRPIGNISSILCKNDIAKKGALSWKTICLGPWNFIHPIYMKNKYTCMFLFLDWSVDNEIMAMYHLRTLSEGPRNQRPSPQGSIGYNMKTYYLEDQSVYWQMWLLIINNTCRIYIGWYNYEIWITAI